MLQPKRHACQLAHASAHCTPRPNNKRRGSQKAGSCCSSGSPVARCPELTCPACPPAVVAVQHVMTALHRCCAADWTADGMQVGAPLKLVLARRSVYRRGSTIVGRMHRLRLANVHRASQPHGENCRLSRHTCMEGKELQGEEQQREQQQGWWPKQSRKQESAF